MNLCERMIIEVNGIKIGYDIFGQTGLPLMLVHGFGLNREIWKGLAEKYLRNHRVILPDVRGHGESEAIEGVYPMETLAEDLAHLLDYLGIKKVVICGHSMGGYISLAFADMFPESLAGFGMITTHSEADSDEKKADRYALVEAVKEQGSIVVAESLAPKLSQNQTVVKETQRIIAETDPRGIIGALLGMAERPDRSDLLPEIHVPSLVVAGESDPLINIEQARTMADRLPSGTFLSIPHAGHMPMLENPLALGEGIVSLCERVIDAD